MGELLAMKETENIEDAIIKDEFQQLWIVRIGEMTESGLTQQKWCSQRDIPKSKLGDAINYSLNQREYLENFLLDGRLEISNNRAKSKD